ncbi:UNVERIFIED_ORG: BtrH N-terminal domain-containing protein [Shinella sp. XGS7]|nr:BtrH N-terminal domain-containing protein [Shinella sp. XGS7]
MKSVRIEGLQAMQGQHCETVATGTLLRALGVNLTEPMLFGLGEGLSFVFLNLEALPLPFVGGRVKPFELTTRLCRHLGVECQAVETSSRSKAWAHLEAPLSQGKPVGLQLDCYYLDYFRSPLHFAGHFVAAYGFDEEQILLVDTQQQGGLQQARRSSVEQARFAKGPMAARARSWTLSPSPTAATDLPEALRSAIHANARAYLEPPFRGASHLGIRKLADSLPHWLALSQAPESELAQAALMMERAGTGGALFRNFYRDFLSEAQALLPREQGRLERARRLFSESADAWTAVAALIDEAGVHGAPLRLGEAAGICTHIADIEVKAMQELERLGH